jgi:hypothetical protein
MKMGCCGEHKKNCLCEENMKLESQLADDDGLSDLAQIYKSISLDYEQACAERDRLYDARSLAIENMVLKAGSQKLEIDGIKIYAVKRKGRWYIKGESKDEGFVLVS